MKKTWEDINWQDIIKFKWFKRLYVLYIFGFVLNFRPSAPFIFEFLTNCTEVSKQSNITEDIFPVLFYSAAPQSLLVFLLVDFFHYNPFIIVTCLSGIISTCLYIWSPSSSIVAQAFSGSMVATDIAYYVCIYAHCDVKDYQRFTSYIRAAPLGGKMISSLLAQLFIWKNWLDYKQLYYFDLSALILAAVIFIFLPPVDKEGRLCEKKPVNEKNPANVSHIFSNFIGSFPNKYVVKWSIWSIFTISVYNQISIYIQPLWKQVQTDRSLYRFNGSVEGIYAIFALIGTILGGFASFDWKFKGDLILSFISLLQFFSIIFVSLLENVSFKCFFYVMYGFMFHFIVTILSGEIAKLLNRGCFGLVFGFIAFIAAILSCGMVCAFNDKVGFRLESEYLFMAYGYYHLALAVLFIIIGLSYWFAKHTYPV